MRFKIGDQVKMLIQRHQYPEGTIVTIRSGLDEDGDYEIYYPDGDWGYVNATNLAPLDTTNSTKADVALLVQDLSTIVDRYGMDNVYRALDFLRAVK